MLLYVFLCASYFIKEIYILNIFQMFFICKLEYYLEKLQNDNLKQINLNSPNLNKLPQKYKNLKVIIYCY